MLSANIDDTSGKILLAQVLNRPITEDSQRYHDLVFHSVSGSTTATTCLNRNKTLSYGVLHHESTTLSATAFCLFDPAGSQEGHGLHRISFQPEATWVLETGRSPFKAFDLPVQRIERQQFRSTIPASAEARAIQKRVRSPCLAPATIGSRPLTRTRETTGASWSPRMNRQSFGIYPPDRSRSIRSPAQRKPPSSLHHNTRSSFACCCHNSGPRRSMQQT